MSLLALIFSFIAISNASPEACTTIDFRDRVGPIKNQLDTPWCFAFSAADLASFASGENISPYPIALAFHGKLSKNNSKCGESISEGGYLDYPFNNSNQYGFCTEEQVASLNEAVTKNKSAIHELYTIQENLIRFREVMLRDCQDIPGYVSYELARNLFWQNPSLLSSDIFKNMFPSSNIEDIVDALVHPSLFEYPESSLAILANSKCNIKTPYKAVTSILESKEIISVDSQLNKILESGEIASLGVNLTPFISAQNVKSFYLSQEINDYYAQQKICEQEERYQRREFLHAFTLVGRQYDPQRKTCEYIIKNSWGTDCNEKSSIIPKLKCKDGYLFLTKNEIAQMIKSITVLEKKN